MRRALTVLAAAVACCAAAAPIRVPSDIPDPALSSLGSLERVEAIAVSDDGNHAAAAIGEEGKKPTTVRLAVPGAGKPILSEVPGRVRALRFGEPPSFLYALVHRPAKRGPGTTSLVQIDVDSGKALRGIRVPASASDLTLYDRPGTLLVVARDEVRSFRVPEMSSGPLFRVPGDNRAIAWLPGTDRVVIGQADGVVDVDLTSRQEREGMPVRDRLATDGPVAGIEASPEGGRALLRLEDGRTFDLDLGPLGLHENGTSIAIAWPGRPASPERAVDEAAMPEPAVEAPTREPVVEAPAQEPVAQEMEPPAEEPVVAEAPAPREIEPPPAMPEPAVEAPTREPVVEEAVPPAEVPREPVEERVAVPQPRDAIRGRLSGDAAGAVAAVVLMGPDSVIVEAARVAPAADGSFSFEGLAPGRYRVVLDGGGGRVLVSQPSFHTVTVGPEPSPPVEFRVLRSL